MHLAFLINATSIPALPFFFFIIFDHLEASLITASPASGVAGRARICWSSVDASKLFIYALEHHTKSA